MARRYQRGALLLEAAVGIVLLLLFFNTVVFTGTSQMRWSRNYEQTTFANDLLSSSLSDMRANLKDWYADKSEIKTETRDGVTYTVECSSKSDATKMLELSCHVSWTDGIKHSLADQLRLSSQE